MASVTNETIIRSQLEFINNKGEKAMTKKFIGKVKLYGVVDTRKYRYVYHANSISAWIERLPIDWLDTTRAIDGWETVKRF